MFHVFNMFAQSVVLLSLAYFNPFIKKRATRVKKNNESPNEIVNNKLNILLIKIETLLPSVALFAKATPGEQKRSKKRAPFFIKAPP